MRPPIIAAGRRPAAYYCAWHRHYWHRSVKISSKNSGGCAPDSLYLRQRQRTESVSLPQQEGLMRMSAACSVGCRTACGRAVHARALCVCVC